MTDQPLYADARTRAAELFEQYAATTADRLAKRYRGVDPHRIADAVVEAILRVSREWEPPNDLRRVLAENARQKLRTFLRGETHRRQREQAIPQTQSSILSVEDRDCAEQLKREIASTDLERTALDHWLVGQTSPNDLARELNIPEAEAIGLLARLRQRIHRLKAKVNRDN